MYRKYGYITVLDGEIGMLCEYEEKTNYIKGTMTKFPKRERIIGWIKSHPEVVSISTNELLETYKVVVDVKVEELMPFDAMVRKCFDVIAGAIHTRISPEAI